MSKLSRYFRFRDPAVQWLLRRIRSPGEAGVYFGLPEDRGFVFLFAGPIATTAKFF
jgi:hypothetical protein